MRGLPARRSAKTARPQPTLTRRASETGAKTLRLSSGAVAESQRQIAQQAAERLQNVTCTVAQTTQGTVEDTHSRLPLPDLADRGLKDLHQGVVGLVEGVVQTNPPCYGGMAPPHLPLRGPRIAAALRPRLHERPTGGQCRDRPRCAADRRTEKRAGRAPAPASAGVRPKPLPDRGGVSLSACSPEVERPKAGHGEAGHQVRAGRVSEGEAHPVLIGPPVKASRAWPKASDLP